jgi:2-polyprenyl-3-methyl-5-hydroxy-6-metoxy-1,4-benzoquinol methylase
MIEHYHSSVRHDIVPLVPPSERLLDVGGGTGATARHLREIGRARAVGVLDAVVEAHREGLDFAAGVDLDDHAALAGFLADHGPFSTILALDVLEHLIDPWGAVGVLAAHLAPGGTIVASIPNIRHLAVSGALLFGNRWRYEDAGLLDRTHLRFFVRETAIELLQRPGLQVEQVVPSPIGRTAHKLANAVTFGRLRSLFTLQYFVVAKRHG